MLSFQSNLPLTISSKELPPPVLFSTKEELLAIPSVKVFTEFRGFRRYSLVYRDTLIFEKNDGEWQVIGTIEGKEADILALDLPVFVPKNRIEEKRKVIHDDDRNHRHGWKG